MQKFFPILSYPRCGSHFLGTSIGGHSQCSFFGEMMSFDGRLRGFQNRNDFEKVLEFFRDEFRSSENGTAIFHSFAGESHPVFGPIHQTPSFYFEKLLRRWKLDKFIILERRNLLARFVSHKLASEHKIWQLKLTGPSIPLLTCEIPPESLRLDFEHMANVSQLTREKARLNGEFIIVYYEDLSDRFEAQMARVFGFMGLPFEPVEPLTAKVEARPLSIIVRNWDELLAHFKDTQYASFFDESNKVDLG